METTKKRHVIWVTPGFAANEQDSQCIPPMQLFAKALIETTGIALHIVSLHYPKSNTPYARHVAQVYPCARKGPGAKTRTRIAAYRQITKLLKQYPGALLHSFWMTDACLVAHLANRRFGARHLVTLMGQDARPSNRYLNFLSSTAMTTIGLSLFHAEQFYRTTGTQVDHIVPWGLEAANNMEVNTEKTYDIIGVGSLIPLKQYDLFVRIIARVKITYPRVKVALIGEGPERKKLAALIQELGLQDNLRLYGALPRKQVLEEYMQRSKILLHTSSYESFGFVLLEALAQGCSVVATPVGIAPELADCTTAKHEEDLVAALLDTLKLSVIPKPSVPYPLSEVLRRYLDLYDHSGAEMLPPSSLDRADDYSSKKPL